MSVFGKYLWPITIDTTNNDFGLNDGGGPDVVAITSGTYDTILEVCQDLEDELVDLNAEDWEVEVSALGIVTITNNTSDWDVDWANTDDALEAMLGFDGTETVTGAGPYVLTGSSQHLYGYYPGCISWGYTATGGVGTVTPRIWRSIWPMVRNVAGNNAQRIVGPANARETMNVGYGIIHRDEYEHALGLKAFGDAVIATSFRFYPDRADGTVAAKGTQNTEYWKVTLNRSLTIRPGSHPDHMTFQLEFNQEPT
jgi:hypothetical protein